METTHDDTPRPGQVGRYRLLARVGAGGMGTVYRAHDPLLDRIVAVKLPHFEGPPEQRSRRVQRFEREARAAAQVLHPHVCPIYDVGAQDGQPFVVMAFLEGPSLAQRLAQSGRFEDVGEAVRIIGQLLGALAAVHAHGIVHRDLKPGNVLFDASGRALLTDFGLARPDEAEPLTSEGAILGTPAYMAPEQAAGRGDRIGPWTDLYSLGVLLYQMVTGRLPFEGPAVAVLPRIVAEEPPPPRRFRPDLDPAVEAVILKALRKEPGERFRDAAAFAAELPGMPLGAPTRGPLLAEQPTVPLTISTQRKRRWTPLRLLGWAVGAALVMIPAGFLAFLIRALIHTSDTMDIRVLQICGVLCATLLALFVALLGVSVWGWVEATRVPEGLLYFARHGLVGWARRAVARGVAVDARNDLGETPLLLAAAHGQTEMVKLLLLSGADPTAPDRLGQRPLDAARTKGHADIADLLGRYARPASATVPDAAPVWRPNARRWLLAAVTLGAALSVAANYLYAYRRQITPEDFLRLVGKTQVKAAVYRDEAFLFGEVRNPDAEDVRALGLTGGRFWLRVPPGFPKGQFWLRPGEPIIVHPGGIDTPLDYWLGNWVVLPMLAWPVGVLSLVFLPLIGSPNTFPFLALAPPRRTAASPTRPAQ